MDWIRHRAWEREFDGFAAEAWEPLLRTGYLMTGDAKDAEDLVQETLLKVARRWSRVRSMDHPAAYARRILINLVLYEAGRRSRQRAGPRPPTTARHGPFKMSMTWPNSAGRWRGSARGNVPSWCCATGPTCPSPRL